MTRQQHLLPRLLLPLLLSLTGCSSLSTGGLLSASGEITHTRQQAMIADLPFHPQQDYQCGPAALATILSANGSSVTPEQLLPLVYLPEQHGSVQPEMLAAPRSFGMLGMQIPASLDALLSELDQHNPVLIMQNLGLKIYPQWHYAVVKGYDLGRRIVVLNSGRRENYELALPLFLRTWKRAGNWAMVVTAPGSIPASVTAADYLQAALPLLQTGTAGTQKTLLEAGLQRWPQAPGLMLAYGNFLYENGMKARARAWFSSVTLIHPDSAYAFNNLAHIEAEFGRTDAARAASSRALALAGKSNQGILATYQQIHGLNTNNAPRLPR